MEDGPYSSISVCWNKQNYILTMAGDLDFMHFLHRQ